MGAFKLFHLIARRQNLSRDEFQDYLRHPHGSWTRKVSGLRGYVQSHRIDSPLCVGSQSRFEAISEIWLDGPRDVKEFLSNPIAASHLANDLSRFADISQCTELATEENILQSSRYVVPDAIDEDALWSHLNRPLTTKLIALIEGDNRDWFCEKQVALARRLGAFRQSACVCVRMLGSDEAPAYLGVREFWWGGDLAFHRAMTTDAAGWKELKKSMGAATLILTQSERFL